jgi:hypothetical protein
MKVDLHQSAGATAQAVGQGAASQGVRSGDGDLRSGIDSLSQDRLELSGLVFGAARRAEHVTALAELYRKGAYTSDPSALSHKLVQDGLARPESGNEDA